MGFDSMPLWVLLALFAGAGGVILVCGIHLTGQADRIADRTGLGEALVGGVLLGAATSLSGTVVSVTAALDGRASLAFSNGVGGIAAQTAFLAIADIVYRRGNLEHVAADVSSLFQCALLMLLLAIPWSPTPPRKSRYWAFIQPPTPWLSFMAAVCWLSGTCGNSPCGVS